MISLLLFTDAWFSRWLRTGRIVKSKSLSARLQMSVLGGYCLLGLCLLSSQHLVLSCEMHGWLLWNVLWDLASAQFLVWVIWIQFKCFHLQLFTYRTSLLSLSREEPAWVDTGNMTPLSYFFTICWLQKPILNSNTSMEPTSQPPPLSSLSFCFPWFCLELGLIEAIFPRGITSKFPLLAGLPKYLTNSPNVLSSRLASRSHLTFYWLKEQFSQQ